MRRTRLVLSGILGIVLSVAMSAVALADGTAPWVPR
jgi:hypothetical protein